MSAPPKQCTATCAHGRQCSREAAPYGYGMCEQHRTQANRQDRDAEHADRVRRGIPWYIDDTGRP